MAIKMGQAHLKKKMAQDHLKKKMAQIVVTAQFKMGSPCLVPSLSLSKERMSFCQTRTRTWVRSRTHSSV
jgi:hypothetical protein